MEKEEIVQEIKTVMADEVKKYSDLAASKDELQKLTDGLEAVKSDINTIAEKQANAISPDEFMSMKKQASEIAKKISADYQAGKFGEKYEIKAVGDMGLGNIGAGIVQPNLTPVSETRNRTFAMFELANVFSTNAPITDVTQEGEEGDPTFVGETGDKTQIDFNLTPTTYTPQYCAGYATVSRLSMLNLPYLENMILNNLRMRTMAVANTKCLSGNGTTDLIKGLLEFAPTFAVSGVHENAYVSPTLYHALILATTDVYSDALKSFMPNAIFIHPIDAAGLKIAVIEKQINLPQILVQNGQLFVNGVPLKEDPSMAQGTIVVGDFNYSNIAIQDQYNVLIDPYTLMLKNQVRIRGEMCLTHYVQKGDLKAFRKFNIATVLADLTKSSS